MTPNPTPAPNVLGWLVLGGFVAAVGYALFAPKKAAAAAGCVVDEDRIDAWGKARKFYVMWFSDDAAPPATWAILDDQWLKKEWPTSKPTIMNTVVVTRVNGKFWTYDATGKPREDAARRADYCAFTG